MSGKALSEAPDGTYGTTWLNWKSIFSPAVSFSRHMFNVYFIIRFKDRLIYQKSSIFLSKKTSIYYIILRL